MSRLNLANKLYEIVLGIKMPLEIWGFYLFSKEFQGEEELRNKVFAVWLCSLFDGMEAQTRFLSVIEDEAQGEGDQHISDCCIQFRKLSSIISEVIEHYSKAEQVFIRNLRNQYVHGYLWGRNLANITFKWCEGGELKSEVLSAEDYHAIDRQIWEEPGSLDDKLQLLRNRLESKSLRFWTVVREFQEHDQEIYQILRDGGSLNFTA